MTSKSCSFSRAYLLRFVSEINGLVVGGDVEFVVHMDMRVAAPDARLGIPEVADDIVQGGDI